MPFVHEGAQFVRKRGSRAEVLSGIAFCTSGGLRADDLEEVRDGRIVSKKRAAAGRQRYAEKNPFTKVEPEPDEKAPSPKKGAPEPRKRKVKVVETPVTIRVPVARRKRTQGRRRRK